MKRKPKQTRKEKLRARAERNLDHRMAQRTNLIDDMIFFYEAGYKAAMSDVRRALRDGDSGINKFLRPIR